MKDILDAVACQLLVAGVVVAPPILIGALLDLANQWTWPYAHGGCYHVFWLHLWRCLG
jgi:hypothetical protein